jgi:hypothetical protein
MDKEYEDPHYHDEEQELDPDERRREGRAAGKKKPTRELPLPRRRHYED